MKNLKNLFFTTAQEKRDLDFILTREKNFTYSDVLTLVKKFAYTLESKGVRKGDRVALITEKSPEQIILLLAIWSIGAIAVPINENLTHHELEFILGDSTPTLTFLSQKYYDLHNINNKCLINSLYNETSFKMNFDDLEESSIACLIYTSGSTGNPKGVMLSHKNFYINGETVVIGGHFLPTDIYYSILPYWHSFALTTELISPILVGGKIAITANAKTFAQDMTFFNPSIIFVVPRVAEILKSNIIKKMQSLGPETYKKFNDAFEMAKSITDDTPIIKDTVLYTKLKVSLFDNIKALLGQNFRFMISGGAPIDINLQRFFGVMDIKIMQGYGLTEATPVISVDKLESHIFGSCGNFLPWITEGNGDFTFKDENGNFGKELIGELLVKGDCVMLGYWNHKDQSAKTVIDGWLYTGDMGYFKNDKLYLNGRKSNMIVLNGGENVHPEFIENILKDSPYINDLMVFGDKCKNLYAVITLPEEFLETNDIYSKIKESIKILTKELSPFQKPKDFIIVEAFNPENGTYTATQKIKRHQILSLYKNEIQQLLISHGEPNII